MKRITNLLVVVAIVGVFGIALIPGPVSAMTGSGTAGDPYIIYDVGDLQDMNLAPSAYYELANDIDASATVGWNGGAGFAPIGTVGSRRFTGHFDGNNYTISDLYINRPSTQYVALFEDTLGAVIQNVVLEDWDITGLAKVGTIVANAQNTILRYLWVSGGSVEATDSASDVGGICYACGGSGSIYRCFSSASVSGAGSSVGGFSGQTATIYESYCYGDVSGTSYVGGLAGQQHSGIIQNSFARGSVSGISYVGGLVGRMTNFYAPSTVDNCYSTGTSSIMGLIGGYSGTHYVTDSFWDIQTSGCPTSAGGTGKTTTEMKTQSTFTDAGWDFDTIWAMGGTVNDGYPYFLWWYQPVWMIEDIYQVVWFQPNYIIQGTELPNRTGNEDGEIHWGANPDGITITYTELIPEEEYYFEPDFGPLAPGGLDIIKPEPELPTTDVDLVGLEDNPLNPLAQMIADASGGQLTVRLAWLGMAWIILIAAMLLVHLGPDTHKDSEKPHHFVLTSLTGLGLSILFYSMGIFPLWVPILMCFGLGASIVYERMPVL